MGYSTDFYGTFSVTPALTEEQAKYINTFSETRRMKRDVNKLMELYKGKYGYPGRTGTAEEIYGNDGEFFVMDDGNCGQTKDASVIDYNTPPGQLTWEQKSGGKFLDHYQEERKRISSGECQSGLWCQWIIGENNDTIEHDGGEKFYNYVEWLIYLIENFFKPWGITVNGEVEWSGEERSDIGKIVVTDNKVQALEGRIEY